MSKLNIGLTGDLKRQLQQFEEKLQNEVLTGAVAAGARVLYNELLIQVPVAKGVLKSSVYRYMDRETEKQPKRTYFVGINMAEAPHWWLVEYGHMETFKPYKGKDGKWYTSTVPWPQPRFVPGTPYLRPTATKMSEALEAVKVRFAEKIKELSK